MTDKPENPPAFPTTEGTRLIYGDGMSYETKNGMLLRDYFAAAALQGLLANGELPFSDYATESYAAADAMLKARSL